MRRVTTMLTAALLVVGALLPATAQAQEDQPAVSHHVIEGEGGTPIYATLFLPPGASGSDPVPLVLRSHGWGGRGENGLDGLSSTSQALLDAGYALFTWDERGFGWSGGEVHVLKPELEGADAQLLLDWIVANVPEIAREGDDPIVGMTGGSYGGGIQTLLSALDPRIDAIVPEITWYDLRYSLSDNGVINLGWGQLLYAAGLATATGDGMDPQSPTYPQEGAYAQEIHQAEAEGTTTNTFSEATLDFFGASSLALYGEDHPIDVPALFIQGSVDTLFDLSEASWLRDHVAANGAPTRFVVFCGGHVSCPDSYETPETPDREYLDQAILDWFAKHLRGEDVDTGAPVTYRTNLAGWTDVDAFPPSDATAVTVEFDGSVVNPGSPSQEDEPSGLPGTTAAPSQDGDPRMTSVEVLAAEDGPVDLVGIPQVEVTVEGQGIVHLFFKLVDREAGHVVNFQETPLRVDFTADGSPQQFTIPLSGVAYTLAEGSHLDLQIATNSLMHVTSRVPGEAAVSGTVEVPVVRSSAAGAPGGDGGADGAPAGDEEAGGRLAETGGGLVLLALPALFLPGLWYRKRR